MPVVIVGAPAGNHFAVGHTTVAVPPEAPLVSHKVKACELLGLEKVSVHASPLVKVSVKQFPFAKFIVAAVVQVESAWQAGC